MRVRFIIRSAPAAAAVGAAEEAVAAVEEAAAAEAADTASSLQLCRWIKKEERNVVSLFFHCQGS